MTRFALLLVVAGSGAATADPEPSAIATNLPMGWVRETSVAGSLYVPVGARDAIRTNVATTTNHTSVQKDLSDLLNQTLGLINASLPITQQVSRADIEAEGYLRFGFVP